MFHSKSKSNKIQQKEKSINIKEETEKPNTINEYVSTTANQINSTNDNLGLNLSNDDNTGKLSSLFYDEDNSDKIVNISKLDESLNYKMKNTNRDNKINTKNIIDDLQNSDVVINISCLDSQIDAKEINNEKNLDNINNNINSNMNVIENKQNKIIEKKDEIFMIKKRSNNIIKKLIILVVILLLFIISLIIIFIIYIF